MICWGDLGKPVDQVRRKQAPPPVSRQPEPGRPIEDSSSDSEVEAVPKSNDPLSEGGGTADGLRLHARECATRPDREWERG